MTGVSVAFLRGVNVGGHGRLPMADLRDILAGLGARQVATYIQSGNAVFRGNVDPEILADAIAARRGFRPACIVLDRAELAAAIAANPFPQAAETPKSLHLFFLTGNPGAQPEALDRTKAPAERWHLAGRRFYLHTPEGLSRSRLAPDLDRRLGTGATGRNWATVTRVLAMANALDTG